MKRHIHVALAVVLAIGSLAAQAPAAVRLNKDRSQVMVDGYDVVAYFTDGKPVPGMSEFEVVWQDAKWRFASAEHRDLFRQAPEKYAPQYGSFCAYAVSRGYTADTDPEAWTIVDGRLFLNYSKKVQATWQTDRAANIEKADANWPALSRTTK